jgi:hypothetical protein
MSGVCVKCMGAVVCQCHCVLIILWQELKYVTHGCLMEAKYHLLLFHGHCSALDIVKKFIFDHLWGLTHQTEFVEAPVSMWCLKWTLGNIGGTCFSLALAAAIIPQILYVPLLWQLLHILGGDVSNGISFFIQVISYAFRKGELWYYVFQVLGETFCR